jgi:hypothetical protein
VTYGALERAHITHTPPLPPHTRTQVQWRTKSDVNMMRPMTIAKANGFDATSAQKPLRDAMKRRRLSGSLSAGGGAVDGRRTSSIKCGGAMPRIIARYVPRRREMATALRREGGRR